MKLLGPEGKLDARFYYTAEEARSYLEGLSHIQREFYLYGELVDFWFMANYSWILFLLFRSVQRKSRKVWWSLLTGALDFAETFLIIIYLRKDKFFLAHEFLPCISSLKWFSALLLILYLCIKKLRTASR